MNGMNNELHVRSKDQKIEANNFFIDFLNDAVQDLDVTDQHSLMRSLFRVNALFFTQYCINKKVDPDDRSEMRCNATVFSHMEQNALQDYVELEVDNV